MIELNMDVLLEKPGAVIHCKTDTEAYHLLKYLKKYYPNKVSNWRDSNTEWDVYEDDSVYYVYWERPGNKMLYGNINAVSYATPVVEFESLIRCVADFPIQLGDMDIESLFG